MAGNERMIRQKKQRPAAARGSEKQKYGILLDDAFQKMKQMMYNNQLVPGQKIIYSDLAKKLNTSITPIIQALKRFEAYKVVQYFPKKGYLIAEITETELRDLFEAREALEVFLLPKIIKNINRSEIETIRSFFRKVDMSDPRKWVIHDGQFHLKIAEYAKNEVMYHMLEEVLERTYLRYNPHHLGEQRLKNALQEHREILNSLLGGNLKEVREVISKHISHQLEHTVNYMLKSSW